MYRFRRSRPPCPVPCNLSETRHEAMKTAAIRIVAKRKTASRTLPALSEHFLHANPRVAAYPV